MFKAKDWIFAKWNDKDYWYEGMVEEVKEDGSQIHIGYTDGTDEWLPIGKVMPQKEIPLGTKVECRWNRGEDYYVAEIIEIDQGVECTGRLYKVRYEDGVEEWTSTSFMRIKAVACSFCGELAFGEPSSCPGCGASLS
jgi:hypothetical protein